jgi:O-antigen ligase
MRPTFRQPNPSRGIKALIRAPSGTIEYGYYLTTAYIILGGYFGLEIPLLAAGLTVTLASLCLYHFGLNAKIVLAPVALLLAAMITSIGVQIVVYDTPFLDGYTTRSILWVAGTIIVQSLLLRPGFLCRCSIVLLVLGVIPLRELTFGGGGGGAVEQARLDVAVQGNLSHPAGLAYWFGFCVLFFAIAGLEEKRVRIQILYWTAAVGSLLVVALTVERGPLLAVAVALTIALRRILKVGFVPVLLLLILTGIVLESGLFADSAEQYQTRGLEDTGRLTIWALVIDRILESPLVGVGATNVGSQVAAGVFLAPHNAFLYFALASGVVPFALFLGFWLRAGLVSLIHRNGSGSALDVFRLPFLIYGFAYFMLGDGSPDPWVLLILSVVAGHGILQHVSRIAVLRRIGRTGGAPALARPSPVQRPR